MRQLRSVCKERTTYGIITITINIKKFNVSCIIPSIQLLSFMLCSKRIVNDSQETTDYTSVDERVVSC